MNAFEYADFCKYTANKTYDKLNCSRPGNECSECMRCVHVENKVMPIVGLYYRTCNGERIETRAFLHPDDNFKNVEDMKYHYADL